MFVVHIALMREKKLVQGTGITFKTDDFRILKQISLARLYDSHFAAHFDHAVGAAVFRKVVAVNVVSEVVHVESLHHVVINRGPCNNGR